MIKYIIPMLLLSTSILANDVKVLKYEQTKNNLMDNDAYFLVGSDRGSYIVNSWSVSKSKAWSGKGEPDLSVGQAINTAETYLKNNKLLLKRIDLNLSINNSRDIIWYYTLSFVKDLYNPRATIHDVVILTSGEIVEPWR